MSRSRARRILSSVPVFLLLVVTLSGCISEAPGKPDRVAGAGTGGTVYRGWDYDGATGVPLNGSIQFALEDETNNGTVVATGEWEGQNITITMDRFEHSTEDFHSGGVAVHIPEHGDTGNGDTLIPEIFALVAAWGPASVRLGEEPMLDPYTGNATWSAHLMVTDTGIRDETDGGKVKSNTGVYSPDAPTDAVVQDDHEAILILQSTAPAGDLNATSENVAGSVGQPETGPFRLAFDVPAIGSVISAVVDFGQEPTETGPYIVRILNESGTQVQTRTLGGAQTQIKSAQLDLEAQTMGSYTLEVLSTLGVPGTFTGNLTVTPPARPLYWLHWETVQIDEGGR